MKVGGAYILDTLEGSRIGSPYPEPASSVIVPQQGSVRRKTITKSAFVNGAANASSTGNIYGNGARGDSRVSLSLSNSNSACPTPRSGSTVDLHSRPMSSLSTTDGSMHTLSVLSGSSTGDLLQSQSRPMSAMSGMTDATFSAMSSVTANTVTIGGGSSRPMSMQTATTSTVRGSTYAPFPAFSYAPPESSISEYTSPSAASALASAKAGGYGHTRWASSPSPSPSASLSLSHSTSPSPSPYNAYNGVVGHYYTPSSSPSPSPSVTPSSAGGSANTTPTKKGWRRWTSPLSGSSRRVSSSAGSEKAGRGSVDVGRGSVDVGRGSVDYARKVSVDYGRKEVESPLQYTSKNGDGKSGEEVNVNGGEMGGGKGEEDTGPLVWSAPSAKLSAVPSKLRKKRKV
ncbi:hypothetical protein NMY22_g6141 [Coprinellus aureogranulatus]|nr:hypothetical protein NMY22_g6141 [Coprinellus aureogranulatus]